MMLRVPAWLPGARSPPPADFSTWTRWIHNRPFFSGSVLPVIVNEESWRNWWAKTTLFAGPFFHGQSSEATRATLTSMPIARYRWLCTYALREGGVRRLGRGWIKRYPRPLPFMVEVDSSFQHPSPIPVTVKLMRMAHFNIKELLLNPLRHNSEEPKNHPLVPMTRHRLRRGPIHRAQRRRIRRREVLGCWISRWRTRCAKVAEVACRSETSVC